MKLALTDTLFSGKMKKNRWWESETRKSKTVAVGEEKKKRSSEADVSQTWTIYC